MIFNAGDSFFLKYNKPLISERGDSAHNFPFYQHPQFQQLVDVLARKEKHHVLLQISFPNKFISLFLEAFLNFTKQAAIPHGLKYGEFIHIDLQHYLHLENESTAIASAFQHMLQALENRDHYVVIAISNAAWLIEKNDPENYNFIRNQFNMLMSHHACRVILINNGKLQTHPFYHVLSVQPFDQTTSLSILNQYRLELEEHHHVYIPEDILPYTRQLAERYLLQKDTLYQTILLLDSSAARTNAMDEAMQQSKPNLKITTLEKVIMDWTNVPSIHLQSNKMNMNIVAQQMQKKIFGQEVAIALLCDDWQQTRCKLHSKLTSYLFCGAEHVGKSASAIAFAENIVGKDALYQIDAASLNCTPTLLDVPCTQLSNDHPQIFKHILCSKPYAFFLIKNIETINTSILQMLRDMLNTGRILDTTSGEYISVKQCLFIFTTSFGKEVIAEKTNRFNAPCENNMMQLVTRDLLHDASLNTINNEEIINAIKIELSAKLPAPFIQALTLIPFPPLSSKAIANILRYRINDFKQNLLKNYQVNLDYAEEIIKHFTQQIEIAKCLDASCIDDITVEISQAITHALMQGKIQKRQHLFLQLNETGESLQAIWQKAVMSSHGLSAG